LVGNLNAPLTIGEFMSQREAIDRLVLVNVIAADGARVRLKDSLGVGSLQVYSPEDAHLAKREPHLELPAGQRVLLKFSR
jgi:hypothetical protein